MKMKWLKKGLIVGGMVAVCFGLLRVYGAYQNEQKTALLAVAQLRQAGEIVKVELAENKAQSACETAWLKYKNKQLDADYIRLTKGEIAHLEEEARIRGDEPTCLEPDTSFEGTIEVTKQALDLVDKEYRIWYGLLLEQRYASDRKLQTRHILHRVWGMLIGAAPETQEEWVLFLSKHYPDIKFGQEEPKFE
jgi:hypothetical protein